MDNYFTDMPAGLLKMISIIEKITKEEMGELAGSFVNAVKMSSRNTRAEMEKWFDSCAPYAEGQSMEVNEAQENLKTLLVELSIRERKMVKIARYGLGGRLFAVAL